MGQRIKTPAASEYTATSTSYLEKKRGTGGGPNFLKLGRAVVYDTDDLDRWLESNKRRSTSDSGGAV